MNNLALVLTIVAIFPIAATFLYRKYLLMLGIFTEKELLVGQCVIAAVLCFLSLIVIGPWWNTLAIEEANLPVWVFGLILTTVFNVIIQFANMRSARLAETSFIAPIGAMTPGLIMITTILIGERPGAWGIVGIIIVAIGTFVHVREGASWQAYFMPLFFWRIFSSLERFPEAERNDIRALRWAYLAACCSTMGLLGDGLIARHGDMILAVTIQYGVLGGVFLICVPNQAHDERSTGPFMERLQSHLYRMIIMGIVFGLPSILLGVSYRLAPIASIGSLKRLSLVFVAVGAVWLLGEKSGKRRILLSMVIVVGAIFISLDPTQAVLLNRLDQWLK
ncbi:hypothetical protein HZC00_00355 [Candidatus Kaiserbacteria bacterium]|nr:hypothetical protein [Candidatus Kaiserbacteria bacterium]